MFLQSINLVETQSQKMDFPSFRFLWLWLKKVTKRSSRQRIKWDMQNKANQAGLNILTNIPTYSAIFRLNQAYSGPIQAHSGIFRTLCNSDIFKILVYSGPRNIQDRGIFRILSNIYDGVFYKIVNGYNYFGKL